MGQNPNLIGPPYLQIQFFLINILFSDNHLYQHPFFAKNLYQHPEVCNNGISSCESKADDDPWGLTYLRQSMYVQSKKIYSLMHA